jgi:hypothetical protein
MIHAHRLFVLLRLVGEGWNERKEAHPPILFIPLSAFDRYCLTIWDRNCNSVSLQIKYHLL